VVARPQTSESSRTKELINSNLRGDIEWHPGEGQKKQLHSEISDATKATPAAGNVNELPNSCATSRLGALTTEGGTASGSQANI
jgi:hypothetical protein